MSKIIAIFFIAISISIVILTLLYINGTIRINSPSVKEYPIRGIDVSHHQKDISWDRISVNENIKFAYIKATEGKDFLDSKFEYNCRAANDEGIDFGLYHFFRLCTLGKEQAKFFIQNLNKWEYDLPPVVDLEFHGNCELIWTNEQLANEITIFIQMVEEVTKKPVVVYTTYDFYKKHIQETGIDNIIWIRDVFGNPNNKINWSIWQYADNGRIEGINGDVDLNVFNGFQEDYETFKSLSSESKIPLHSLSKILN